MIIADDNNGQSNDTLSAEIDLKCAERVTDSDVEESNMDSSDTPKIKVNFTILNITRVKFLSFFSVFRLNQM